MSISKNLNILSVIPDKNTADYLNEVLWSLNPSYHIDVASSGMEAITLLETIYYDLVVIDLNLKDFGVAEVVWFVRNKLTGPIKKVVVMAATQGDNVKSEVDIRKIGLRGIINLPINSEDLEEILMKSFEDKEAESDNASDVLFDLGRLRSICSSEDEFYEKLNEIIDFISEGLKNASKSISANDFSQLFKDLHLVNNKAIYLGSIGFIKHLTLGQKGAKEENHDVVEHSLRELNETWKEIKEELSTVVLSFGH